MERGLVVRETRRKRTSQEPGSESRISWISDSQHAGVRDAEILFHSTRWQLSLYRDEFREWVDLPYGTSLANERGSKK
jgi:hypothetical protein